MKNASKGKAIQLFFASVVILLVYSACKRETNLNNATKGSQELQVVNNGATLRNLIFAGQVNEEPGIKQKSAQTGFTRSLTAYKDNNNWCKYLLLEKKAENGSASYSYIISRKPVGATVNLFSFNIKNGGIILYDPAMTDRVLRFNPDVNKEENLKLKIGGKFYNPEAKIKQVFPKGVNRVAEEAICIDWYWVTTDASTGVVISEIYLYTTCGVNGGGGTSGSDNSPNSNTDGAENICEKSFNFVNTINTSNGVGGWQVAATSNIHMNVVDFATGAVVLLKLPTMYFGLPIVRSTGQYYSANTAATKAAEAVEYAERKVMEYYRATGSLDIIGMSLRYRQAMNQKMQESGGTATLSAPSGSGTITTTVASYNGILGLNCF